MEAKGSIWKAHNVEFFKKASDKIEAENEKKRQEAILQTPEAVEAAFHKYLLGLLQEKKKCRAGRCSFETTLNEEQVQACLSKIEKEAGFYQLELGCTEYIGRETRKIWYIDWHLW